MIACFAQPYSGTSDDAFNPFEQPDAQVAAFYKENRSDIDDETGTARNRTLSSAERVAALQVLFDRYVDQAILVSAELAGDLDTGVASLASGILSNAAVLMDHKMDHGPDPPPALSYAMKKHLLIMSTLRTLVADKREAVRAPATRILASQSDVIGLERISKAANDGIFSEKSAVRFLALASPRSSAPFVEKYLKSDDEDVQTIAVECLVSVPEFQGVVRDKFLLNPKAPLKARLAAARGAINGQELKPLIATPDTPALLYKQVMSTYLQLEGSRLSSDDLKNLRVGLKIDVYSPEELKLIERKFKRLEK